MERLSEGAIDLNDNEVFHNCSYSCYLNIADALNKLKEYEDIGLNPDEVRLFLSDFGITVTKRNRELIKELQEYRKWKMANKKKCCACNGSGYYDSVDRHGNSIKCGACDGTGYED